MKRLLLLIVVAVLTIVVLFFFTNPEFLDKVWFWIIGFIGYIIVLLEKGVKVFSDALKKDKEGDSTQTKFSLPFFAKDPRQKSHMEKLEERILQIEKQLNATEKS